MTDKQLSPDFMRNLGAQPIFLNNDPQKAALLALAINAIMALGDIEHTSDWDPYLKVATLNGVFETPSGYPEIYFGDFNEADMPEALVHHREITSIGFTQDDETIKYYDLYEVICIQIFI
jgi:hypothetical protein